MNLFTQAPSLIRGGKEKVLNIGSKWLNKVSVVYVLYARGTSPSLLLRKATGDISLKVDLR